MKPQSAVDSTHSSTSKFKRESWSAHKLLRGTAANVIIAMLIPTPAHDWFQCFGDLLFIRILTANWRIKFSGPHLELQRRCRNLLETTLYRRWRVPASEGASKQMNSIHEVQELHRR